MIFLLSKCLKWKLFIVHFWITFCLTIFLKELAEKSYSTFNFDFFLLTFVVDEFVFRRRRPAPTHHFIKTNNKCQKKKVQIKRLNNFFQQVLVGKWLNKMWFRIEQWITFISYCASWLAKKSKLSYYLVLPTVLPT